MATKLVWRRNRRETKILIYIIMPPCLFLFSCWSIAGSVSGEFSFECSSSSLNGSSNSPNLMLNCCLPFPLAHSHRFSNGIWYSREENQFALMVVARSINLKQKMMQEVIQMPFICFTLVYSQSNRFNFLCTHFTNWNIPLPPSQPQRLKKKKKREHVSRWRRCEIESSSYIYQQ